MSEEEKQDVPMAECGACRTVIPLDSEQCPECNTKFSGVSDEALGECGACSQLVPLDSTRCPECGVVFVADDVVDILRTWVHDTGINIRKLFDKFDENSDGTIDSSELKKGLLSLNLADLPPSQVERLVAEIDADGNGVIDLDEFEGILMGESGEGSDADASESSSVEEASSQEEGALGYNENVLGEVMKSHGIGESEKEAFIAFAMNHNADENSYLKKEELEAAARGWNEQDAHEQEESSVEQAEESVEETVEDDDEENDDEIESEEVEADTVSSEVDDDDAEEEPDEDESEESEGDDEGIEDEDFDLEEDNTGSIHPLQALADMMDEHEISAQRMFNDLDMDGNGLVSLDELKTVLAEKYGDILDADQVDAIMEGVDADGDGMIDVTEFIGSLETLDDHEEVIKEPKPEKEFPTPMQKKMMSKQWNDVWWPIIHVGFGIMITLVLVNALIGPVDGTGGTIVYEAADNGVTPPRSMNLVDGVTTYPCDAEYQLGGCSNSLTPLAGENGASSMPKGFYWDGIVFLLLSIAGIGASLFTHLVQAPAWRARMKAMKEFEDDKADAAESIQEDEEDESDIEVDDDEDTAEEDTEEGEDEEDDEEGEPEDEGEDDEIDIGSHIGLTLEDEEVFGTILEFDDDEGTVTIEEDGTGDLITGYQEDMFLE